MTGKMPAEGVNQTEFPDVLYDLWRCFLNLNAARGGGMGPSPISYLELHAYSQLHRIRFEAWEMDALRQLDNVAMVATG